MESSVQDAIVRTRQSLCHACRAIFDGTTNYNRSPPEKSHHPTAVDCHKAAQLGCPICTIIWRNAVAGDDDGESLYALKLNGPFSEWSIRTNRERAFPRPDWSDETILLSFSISNVGAARGLDTFENTAKSNLDFAMIDISERPEDAHRVMKSNSTDSEETWQQLQTWLIQCTEKHGCGVETTEGEISADDNEDSSTDDNEELSTDDNGELSTDDNEESSTDFPSRLIDVGTHLDDKVRLVMTEGMNSMPKYITLSHCWGGGKSTLRLIDEDMSHDKTGSWISPQQQEIPLKLLPRTFRHAVEVVRRLDVRYLWIDSLCIVQNSREDWERESKKMGPIYMRSHCTLAADSSPDSDGGLFYERDVNMVNTLVVDPTWDHLFLDIKGPCSLVYSNLWRDSISESCLGKRGWALQERYLSPIVIHFHRDQLFWECCQMECCETFPAGLPHYAADPGVRFKSRDEQDITRLRKTQGGQDVEDDEAEDESLDRYYLWSRLIERYTRTSLTRETDILIAIYGLGRYSKLFPPGQMRFDTDRYVAGLWLDILPSQLLWTVEDFHRSSMHIINADGVSHFSVKAHARRATGPHRTAPTWSWASVIGPVVMPKPLRNGSLIDFRIFDLGTSDGIPDYESASHQHTALWILTGDLYIGEMSYMDRHDVLTLFLYPEGIRFNIQPSKAPETTSSDLTINETSSQASVEDQTASVEDQTASVEDQTASVEDQTGSNVASIESSTSDSSVPESPTIPPTLPETPYVFGLAYLDTVDPGGFRDRPQQVFCLPVMDTRRCGKTALGGNRESFDGISGLLLMPSEPRVPGCYQRIGIFHLIKSQGSKLRGGSKNAADFSQLFWEDKERDVAGTSYSITII